MKKSKSLLLVMMSITMSCVSLISCYEDTPIRDLNLIKNDEPKKFFEGVWSMVEVRVFCNAPDIVNLKAEKLGKCVRDYCHTGSVLEIKQLTIPGNFDFSIDPPAPILSSGGLKYFDNYDEFYSEWGFSNGNLAAFYPIGKEIGTSCWLILEWEKQ